MEYKYVRQWLYMIARRVLVGRPSVSTWYLIRENWLTNLFRKTAVLLSIRNHFLVPQHQHQNCQVCRIIAHYRDGLSSSILVYLIASSLSEPVCERAFSLLATGCLRQPPKFEPWSQRTKTTVSFQFVITPLYQKHGINQSLTNPVTSPPVDLVDCGYDSLMVQPFCCIDFVETCA